jgi:hypothetical protein
MGSEFMALVPCAVDLGSAGKEKSNLLQDGSCRRKREVSIRLQFWGTPSGRRVPYCGDHMVCTLGGGVDNWVTWLRNSHWCGSFGDFQFRCIQMRKRSVLNDGDLFADGGSCEL